MAEGWGSAGAGTALDAAKAAYTWVKLHTGAPGSAGTSNAAANTTRHQATWGTTSAGAFTTTASVDWTGAEVTTTEAYTHYTVWTASSGGSFGWSGTITGGSVTAGTAFSLPIGDLDQAVTLAS